MRRLPNFSFVSASADPAPRGPAPAARPVAPGTPPPRDEMWRSRRVLSGSDWMDAWVRKPAPR